MPGMNAENGIIYILPLHYTFVFPDGRWGADCYKQSKGVRDRSIHSKGSSLIHTSTTLQQECTEKTLRYDTLMTLDVIYP